MPLPSQNEAVHMWRSRFLQQLGTSNNLLFVVTAEQRVALCYVTILYIKLTDTDTDIYFYILIENKVEIYDDAMPTGENPHITAGLFL